MAWLDAEERQRYERFKHPDAARRFFLARVLLKSVVAAMEGTPPQSITLSYSANGKPCLPGPGRPYFSISHSASAVAVAVAPFDIGVDLETVDRPTQPWMRPALFLHPDEAEQVAALPETRRALAFTHRWTCQEAAIKLLDSSVFNREARVKFGEDASTGVCAGRQICFSSWKPHPDTGTAAPFNENAGLEEDGLLLSLAAAQPLPQVLFERWRWNEVL